LVYWLGAIIVVSSFVFVDSEEMKDEPLASLPVVFDHDDEVNDEGIQNTDEADGDRREERESDGLLR